MKQCIITGGGSKFGARLTENFLATGYHVHLITSNGQNWKHRENVSVIDVDWHNLDISSLKHLIPTVDHVDVMFFNHNASSLDIKKFSGSGLQSQKHWQQSYFVACQFPYYFVNTLSKKLSTNSKVGWMLSSLIKYPKTDQAGFADYIGNKVTNACIMKSFSQEHTSCFFGLHPDGGTEVDADTKAADMVNIINTAPIDVLNGNVIDSRGNTLNIF